MEEKDLIKQAKKGTERSFSFAAAKLFDLVSLPFKNHPEPVGD